MATTDDTRDGSFDAVLNRDCFCITLDRTRLSSAIRQQAGEPDLVSALLADRPNLFSGGPVFLSAQDIEAMLVVVAAIEAAARTPAYQEAVLGWGPAIARRDFGPRGVFMGYDFHLGDGGPKLIEVNTNAGGAFLNAFLAHAQGECCREAQDAMRARVMGDFEALVWRMFLNEWALQGRSGQPRTIVIVDDRPKDQYLFPEFLLAQRFFEQRGVTAWVAVCGGRHAERHQPRDGADQNAPGRVARSVLIAPWIGIRPVVLIGAQSP